MEHESTVRGDGFRVATPTSDRGPSTFSSQLRTRTKQYILLTSSMAKLFELPRYIAVEGPIRVGKSTLARVLGERLAAQRVIEPEDDPFLKTFYEGEPGAAFQAQLTFRVRSFEQLLALELGPRANKTVA